MMTSSRIETTTNCRTETTTGYRTETMIVLLLAVVNDLTIRKGQYSELGYCFFHLERLYHHYLSKTFGRFQNMSYLCIKILFYSGRVV